VSAADAERRLREIEAQYEARLAALTRERDELRSRAERAEHERNEFKKLYVLVTLELERLKRQLFGQKAETVDPAQVQLVFGPVLEALERARTGGAAEAGQVESELAKLRERAQAEVTRRKAEKKPPVPHGRRDVSREDLPVELIVIEPPERRLAGVAVMRHQPAISVGIVTIPWASTASLGRELRAHRAPCPAHFS
jgi:transposase